MENNANTQAKAGRGGVIPPVERRFGQPNGNKRGRGFWKKEDTPRYKLEHMWSLTAKELQSIAEDSNSPLSERKLARFIYEGDWKTYMEMINQVYGYPKQEVQQTNIELKPILPKPKRKKE